jgi:hypothetical protein
VARPRSSRPGRTAGGGSTGGRRPGSSRARSTCAARAGSPPMGPTDPRRRSTST